MIVYYSGSHKMKGTAHALFRVATCHRMCYEIIGDHAHNSGDHVHNRGKRDGFLRDRDKVFLLGGGSEGVPEAIRSAFVMQQTGCQGTAFHLMASLVINSLKVWACTHYVKYPSQL